MNFGKNNALFLFAHQDDEFGIFQKIVEEQRKGNTVYCAYLTDGSFRGVSPRRRNLESLRVLQKLNVQTENIFFVGTKLSIPDGFLPSCIEKASEWIHQFLRKHPDIIKIYLPAWEGGHQDHDALHAIGVRIGSALGYKNTIFQFPLYNGEKCRAPFFKIFHPLKKNGPIFYSTISLLERVRFLIYCLSYPSQLKTWFFLFPFVGFHYLFYGFQILQRASIERILERPHSGPLLYEKRGFFSWEKMFLSISILNS